ncbi:MAG TPA: hypothetical protein PKM73_00755 [Verrucomicrobiota bacterium]|nr:hypothetical protein [Verrucomicrobiota bacterium]HNU49872.1 hypothetical protein [Verrucomicrobiota bacterium]
MTAPGNPDVSKANHPGATPASDPAGDPEDLRNRATWLGVALFATAFAWVEAAIVFYLRTMVDRLEPYQPNPLPLLDSLEWVEVVREAATMIMLATVGFIAGRDRLSRLGYALIAFGVWDIFYYVFLIPMTGWPNSLLDWDILFLIPLPWWGPVLAPILIALLMIVWGTLVTQGPRLRTAGFGGVWVLAATALGILLALYVFMADALRTAPQGEQALRAMLPVHFHWPLFIVALALMSVSVARLLSRLHKSTPMPADATSGPPASPGG